MTAKQPITHLLFLDIDGVLNSTRTIIANQGNCGGTENNFSDYLDPIAIKLLRSLSDRGVTFVLSSTWRYGIQSSEELAAFSNKLGIPLHSITPRMKNLDIERGSEIQKWFTEHQIDPDLVHYVILDDDDDVLDHQAYYLVQPHSENGFLLKDYFRICDILELNPDPASQS